ncbi:TonB-dependent siderophore receptor [Caulobacter sp. NIBR1757]|uniref:TonB-dependent receptor n=1 Tax=Caulobacter sp. NIBR1757 TaxID=3016000 RepID=UPI0022F12BF1|nr:TonB-dependent siderophore receptor [Caulobacter sp. NIBR1757]WGM41259.1 putative TonB-dependent receptor BfrD [Caulobacter sp. NIBR1757]
MSSKLSVGVSARAKRALGVAAVAGLAGLGMAGAAFAADEAPIATVSAEAGDASEVSGVDIKGAKDKPSSSKLTAAPLDTPQTITVVSERTLRDQNLLTLRDVLQTVPGITFGAGEGGGGYGDSINLRGYSANNDITTDGLRDSAQYSRTDTFNLQQIEVVNGSNGVYNGSGGVGGSINLVSKSPFAADRTTVAAGVGTDSYLRGTIDSNILIGDDVALRLNAMVHRNDVPGRDVETYERWGIAPSVTFGLGGKTQFTVALFHQEDENTPRYGVPYASNAFLNGPLPGVKPSNYYGYRNIDTQEIGVDSVTLKLRHEFSDNLTLTNTGRWLKVTQLTIVDPPQGTWCLASGFNAQTGAACAIPGQYVVGGPRGNLRDTENVQLANQTDLNWKFETGAVKHNLVVGVAFSNETYDFVGGNVLRNPLGATPNPTHPNMDIANPNNVWSGPVNFIKTAVNDGELSNQAVYAFDNIEFSPMFSINAGIRWENNEGEFTSATIATPYPAPPASPVVTTAPTARNEETLVSYRIGGVFKPMENASIYLAYGNVSTPSQASVNGGCALTGTAQNCQLDPEEGEVIELGTKWDLMDGRLSLTGALFQNTRDKIRLASNDPAIPVQQQDGKSRVRGVTLGASGQILPSWTVIANYTYLDSEILQNVAGTALPPNNIDYTKGDPIPLTPRHAFNVWTTWQINEQWMAGIGANYAGQYAFARASATAPLIESDDYWLLNASVTWTINDKVGLQLNVKNLTDEEYYTNIRSNSGFGWAIPGDARSATLTTTVRF